MVYVIDSLLKGYYPGIGENAGVVRYIPCRHCMSQSPSSFPSSIEARDWLFGSRPITEKKYVTIPPPPVPQLLPRSRREQVMSVMDGLSLSEIISSSVLNSHDHGYTVYRSST
jgi:hypothetical protein